MSDSLKALHDLQAIDLQLAKAQKARASLDDGSARKQRVEACRRDSDTAQQLLNEATAELKDKELNLKTVENKQKTFKDKLYAGTVTNPKELSSMEREIDMLGKQKDKLEERIIELMDMVEERTAALAAANSALKTEEKELEAVLEDRRKKDAVLVKEIKQLIPLRESAAKLVDPVLMKRYETMRPRLGGIAVSRVIGNDCSVCHTHVGAGTITDLKKGEGIQTCDNCGRMLLLDVK